MKKLYINEKRNVGEKPINFIIRLYNEDYGFPTSYNNKECTDEQCLKGKQRSFNDLYCILKSQYSKLTHKQLIKDLYEITLGNPNLIYCPDVNKIVLYYSGLSGSKKNFYFNKSFYDYRALIKRNNVAYTDKFTFEYLYKKLGYSYARIKKEKLKKK